MSYDINLVDPVTHKVLELDEAHHMHGGNYVLGGTTEAWLNITYNYARWYYKPGVFSKEGEESLGIRTIYGLSGAESIPILVRAITALEERTDDISLKDWLKYNEHGVRGYWMPSRENAIRPLYHLLHFAQMFPYGVWEGD